MTNKTISTGYVVMRADGTTINGSVDWPEKPDDGTILTLVRPLIGSLAEQGPNSWFEHVTVLQEGERRDMFVDENGQAKNLPRNDAATEIYRHNWLTQYPGTDPETLPTILGDAVLFLRRIWF